HLRIFVLPPSKTGEGGFFVRGVGDYQQLRPDARLLSAGLLHSGAGSRRGHARCFALHLTKVWRPGSIAEPSLLVSVSQPEALFERTWIGVHEGVWIAELLEALGNREDVEIGRVAVRDFMPVNWCRHTG